MFPFLSTSIEALDFLLTVEQASPDEVGGLTAEPSPWAAHPMSLTLIDLPDPDGCQWLVQRARVIVETPEMLADPDYEPWYPDFPEDCYTIAPCGEPCVANNRGPFCEFHLEAVTMPLDEFETLVDQGRSWS